MALWRRERFIILAFLCCVSPCSIQLPRSLNSLLRRRGNAANMPRFGLALALVASLAPGIKELPSQECAAGPLPAGCAQGRLRALDWQLYLRILCNEVSRSLARDAVLQALAHFDAESANSCPEGFAVTMLALCASGASEFDDMIVRFKPDGTAHFLILAWDLQTGSAVLDHWSAMLPAKLVLQPPWPPWKYPGAFESLLQAQDLSYLAEMDDSWTCDERALEFLGCQTASQLLHLLCSSCTAQGLPCWFSADLVHHISIELKALRSSRMSRTGCGHAQLAALLALNGQSGTAPQTDPQIYRVYHDDRPILVMHSTFKRVAGDADNLFALNIPMMRLSPFPFHTGMLRSARIGVESPSDLYQDALSIVSQSLERHGIGHVILPGDAAAGLPRHSALQSIFLEVLDKPLEEHLKTSLEANLQRELQGPWRLVKVTPGLWQIGEEPYRFSPRADVAFRTFCQECVYISLYFYLKEPGFVLPLAPWVPCRLPWHRLFPVKRQAGLPMAADNSWLRLMQRGPPLLHRCSQSARRVSMEELEEPDLLPDFDISDGVHAEMGLYDLMRQREDSEQSGLHRFSDKIQFKTWMLEEGIPIPKIFHLSSESPEVLSVLQTIPGQQYVVKPTHLAATSYVYVMKDGKNLVSNQEVAMEEIESGLRQAWNDRHLDDWATESTRPGVIVEELVEADNRLGTPDEMKCQTFWGKLLFCEWTYVKNMSSGSEGRAHFDDANLHGDRAQAAMGHKACGIPNFASLGYIFRDGSCLDCAEPVPLSNQVWRQLVQTVEHIARGTDHIRIDIFVAGGRFLVNEANISFLKISKFPAELIEEMRSRWLEGYQFWQPASVDKTVCASYLHQVSVSAESLVSCASKDVSWIQL
ncbi:unnamed protein product [Effrenium voratum]|nr:unnamed protein product [Effrenium voratum]